jgi:hypothetical protein
VFLAQIKLAPFMRVPCGDDFRLIEFVDGTGGGVSDLTRADDTVADRGHVLPQFAKSRQKFMESAI